MSACNGRTINGSHKTAIKELAHPSVIRNEFEKNPFDYYMLSKPLTAEQ